MICPMEILKIQQKEQLLRVKVFKIASNPKYDGYHSGLASMVYKLLDKTSAGSGIKNEITQYQQLTEELHTPIIKKFKKRKVYS